MTRSGSRRAAAAALCVVALAALAAAPAARADDPPPSTILPGVGGGQEEPAPEAEPTPSPTTVPGPAAPSDSKAGAGGGDAPGRGEIPSQYRKLIAGVKRTGSNNTAKLLAALAQLERFGVSKEEAAIAAMGRFPIAGYATYSDDWWNPRFVPYFHLHVGTDVFAAHGTPVRAPVDGTFKTTNGPVGGLAAYVTMRDGTYFYMAHLSGLAPGLVTGQHVKTGQVLGYVGDSGNARGGKPHVHFEIHPRGRGPINPKPYLDRFIADAIAQVPAYAKYYEVMAERRAAAQPAPPAAVVPEPSPPEPAEMLGAAGDAIGRVGERIAAALAEVAASRGSS